MSATKPNKKFERKRARQTKPVERKPGVPTKANRRAKSASPIARIAKAQSAVTSNTPQTREQALREIQGVLRAIPKTKLLKIHANSDVIGKLVLDRVSDIAPYLPRIAKLPEVNHFWVNNLEKIALALLAVSANRPSSRNKVRPDIAAAYPVWL